LIAGRIAIGNDHRQAAWMAKPGSPYFAPVPEHRIVVRRAGPTRRDFIWEIVHSDRKVAASVEHTSTRSFTTMEEAHSDGVTALARFLGLAR
jgi:hypothetical protein